MANPTADTAVWLEAGKLREPRNATHAVVLGTGAVLVVGSDYLTSYLGACGASTDGSDSVEIGDPKTGLWMKTTNLPSLRDAPVVVGLPDGRALLTGGAAGENIGWSAYSSTYVFEPATSTWSRSGLLNTARTETAATVLDDGRVLVAGGLYLDRKAPDHARVLDTAEIWDPTTGTWTLAGGLAGPRFKASAVTLADGRVLVVGGPDSRENDPIPQASTEVYDPATGLWSSAGTLATARSGFTLVALADGGALVTGGYGGLGSSETVALASTERFDPASNMWSAAEDLPDPVAGASGIQLRDGRVLLAGGFGRDATSATPTPTLFDPESGGWTATAPMPGPRAGASVAILPDGSVILVGGSSGEGDPGRTPSCPVADPMVLRYVPGP